MEVVVWIWEMPWPGHRLYKIESAGIDFSRHRSAEVRDVSKTFDFLNELYGKSS